MNVPIHPTLTTHIADNRIHALRIFTRGLPHPTPHPFAVTKGEKATEIMAGVRVWAASVMRA